MSGFWRGVLRCRDLYWRFGDGTWSLHDRDRATVFNSKAEADEMKAKLPKLWQWDTEVQVEMNDSTFVPSTPKDWEVTAEYVQNTVWFNTHELARFLSERSDDIRFRYERSGQGK